ncbi:phosphotransferase enzyme family protein [Nonomuraea typhae]|uniref:phosphotransferase enzyme family protein n=1 Tax=Nonomuraea typhae TaxID=2603600 RepID=UPI0012FB435B|nr:phosphotransferase [Nonomuraea typhae]
MTLQDPPTDIRLDDLITALRTHWDLPIRELTHAPLGFGDHHWTAGGRWFVTAARPARSFDALRAALETAAGLEHDFVVRPIPSRAGTPLVPFGPHYALSIFPLVEGTAGHFGQETAESDRKAMAALLAGLHGSAPGPGAPVFDPALSGRAELEAALDDLGRPWSGGPYAEPARLHLARHGSQALKEVLARFDADAAEYGTGTVLTHGEPHPGNVLRSGDRRLLVDWDTVALAPPERDLWLALGDSRTAWAAYTAATGHDVSENAMQFFHRRWLLDDLSIYVQDFRAPHEDSADVRTAWAGFTESVDVLAR